MNVIIFKFAGFKLLLLAFIINPAVLNMHSHSPQCCKLAQKDVNAVADWSSKNMLPINFDKCISVHYGQFTPSHQYIILQHKIKAMHCLSDLGVCRSNTFAYAEDFLKRVFVSYIRQSLKYASSIW